MRKLLFILSVIFALATQGQVNQTYVQYIDRWSATAVDQMHRYKIPASITLSQGLLESGAGTSRLAREANNHFGIKVSSGWTGPYVKADDDRKGEKFRKYKSAKDSYEDHSKFLQQPRYQRLFTLSPTDYKGWAHGLKACGYATNPHYASLLIKIIEEYNLTQYDKAKKAGKWSASSSKTKADRKAAAKANRNKKTSANNTLRPTEEVNGIPCVKAQRGDTWKIVSQQTGVSVRRLLKYNEVTAEYPITPGMNIFLHKKANKAAREYKNFWHKIKANESMHDISQQYGIRVECLYKMNFRDPSYQPVVGDLLKVR